MSKELDLEALNRPGGMVPVDIETTAALVRQVLKLRDALGDALRSMAIDDYEAQGAVARSLKAEFFKDAQQTEHS
jgi:hypothetical protein